MFPPKKHGKLVPSRQTEKYTFVFIFILFQANKFKQKELLKDHQCVVSKIKVPCPAHVSHFYSQSVP